MIFDLAGNTYHQEIIEETLVENFPYDNSKNIDGTLCSSSFSFFHSAIVFVLIHSFPPVRSAAMQNLVVGLQVPKTVSISFRFL
jgi:hypothetical protein